MAKISASGWGSMLGNTIGALDSLDGKQSNFGAIAAGAGQGMATGSLLGPWGMAGGAVIGGAMGYFKKRMQDKENALIEEQKRTAENLRKNEERSMLQMAQQDLNSRFKVKGMDVPGFYAGGGNVSPDYLAEGGETIQHPYDLPLTLNGDLRGLSSDMSEIVGPSHEHPSGGVAMKGGERIFSDRIPVSKQAVKYFKKNV